MQQKRYQIGTLNIFFLFQYGYKFLAVFAGGFSADKRYIDVF